MSPFLYFTNGLPSGDFVLQIGVDKNDLNKAFIQITMEFLTKEVN